MTELVPFEVVPFHGYQSINDNLNGYAEYEQEDRVVVWVDDTGYSCNQEYAKWYPIRSRK